MRVLFERVLYDDKTNYVCAKYKGFISFLHISICDENNSNTKIHTMSILNDFQICIRNLSFLLRQIYKNEDFQPFQLLIYSNTFGKLEATKK